MTHRAAVLGHPISHSKSPALHRAAYTHLGAELDYSAIDITEDALPAFMARVREDLRQGEGWRGLSTTMPLKAAMVREGDEVRGVASKLGVVNTLAFEPRHLRQRAAPPAPPAWSDTTPTSPASSTTSAMPEPRAAPTAVALGGGGTSAAAIAALKELGAPEADLFVHDPTRAAEARAAAAAIGLPVRVHPLAGAAAALARADVVISTLPPRAADPRAQELAKLFAQRAPGRSRTAAAGTPGAPLDVAYDPWPSRLAAAGQEAGGTGRPRTRDADLPGRGAGPPLHRPRRGHAG